MENHDVKAKQSIASAPKLVVAKVKVKKVYIISYYDSNNFRQTVRLDDSKSFFALAELLNAAHRKFDYKIIDDSYITIK